MVFVLGILLPCASRLGHMLPPALGPQASPQVGEPGRHRSCGGALLLTIGAAADGATSPRRAVRVSGRPWYLPNLTATTYLGRVIFGVRRRPGTCSPRPVAASLGVSDAAPPCYLAEPHHAALRQRELASHVT